MMKNSILLFVALVSLCGCGSTASRTKAAAQAAAEVKEYTYNVVAAYPHPTDAYTQGLVWHEGRMWEGTGQHGGSRIFSTDLATGRSEKFSSLPRRQFGEGIAILGEELFQLTWQSNTAHVYDLKSGRKLREHHYPGEGWGLTTDGTWLYLSNGTSTIYRIDPATFERRGSIGVTLDGQALEWLNELEWIDGRIWANVYTTDHIVIIDPASGIVEGVIDLRGLLADGKRTDETDVLNGIAHDPTTGRLWVTGKNWPELYEIKILER